MTYHRAGRAIGLVSSVVVGALALVLIENAFPPNSDTMTLNAWWLVPLATAAIVFACTSNLVAIYSAGATVGVTAALLGLVLLAGIAGAKQEALFIGVWLQWLAGLASFLLFGWVYNLSPNSTAESDARKDGARGSP